MYPELSTSILLIILAVASSAALAESPKKRTSACLSSF